MTIAPHCTSAVATAGMASAVTGGMSMSAFSKEMLAAKSVMEAQTSDEISTGIPIARDLVSTYGLRTPDLRLTSDSTPDVEYFNGVFKPHFADGMRGVFDNRIIQRGFSAGSNADISEFVKSLPDIALAGLLSFSVLDQHYDEQIARIEHSIEMGKMLRANQSILPARAMGIIRPLIYIGVTFGGVLLAGMLWESSPAISGIMIVGTMLMLQQLRKTDRLHERMLEMLDDSLTMQSQTKEAISQAQARLYKLGPQIREQEKKSLPPIS